MGNSNFEKGEERPLRTSLSKQWEYELILKDECDSDKQGLDKESHKARRKQYGWATERIWAQGQALFSRAF